MNNKIGGFKLQEYQDLVMPSRFQLNEKGKIDKNKVIFILHPAYSFSCLRVVIKRIVYCVFHRFSCLPSNNHLFHCFKDQAINLWKQDEKSIEKIIELFRRLGRVDFDQELTNIERQIENQKDLHQVAIESETSSLFRSISTDPEEIKEEKKINPIQQKSWKPTIKKEENPEKLEEVLIDSAPNFESLLTNLKKLQIESQQNSKTWENQIETINKREITENPRLDFLDFSRKLTVYLLDYQKFKKENIPYDEMLITRDLLVDLCLKCKNLFSLVKNLKNFNSSQSRVHPFIEEINDLEKNFYQHVNEVSKTPKKTGFINKAKGYLKSESSTNRQDLRWKIGKYEILISRLSVSVDSYLKSTGFHSMGNFVEGIELNQEWKKVLLPIFKFLLTSSKLTLIRESGPYLIYLRENYRKLIEDIRGAAKWAKEAKEEAESKHIDAICHCFYSGIELNDYCHQVLEMFQSLQKQAQKMNGKKLEAFDTSLSLIHEIEEMNQSIISAPNSVKTKPISRKGKSVIDQVNGVSILNFLSLNIILPFDSNLSNPAHCIANLMINKNQQSKIVRDIAMGTPTIEYGGGKTDEVAPEFLSHLRHLEREKKKALYINYQDRRKKKRIKGNESNRCNLIHGIPEKEGLEETFIVISLSKNTPFYYQEDSDGISDASEFKNQLQTQFFTLPKEVSGNFIPNHIKTSMNLDTWGKEEMIQKTHEILFENKLQLTQEERKVWIELVDIQLTLKLIIELEVDYYNKTCKDRIDRGAAADTLFFLYLAIMNGQENLPHVKDFIKTMLLVRALLVRKREIVPERLERFIETATFMLNHKEHLKQLHQALFSKIEIQINHFLESSQNKIEPQLTQVDPIGLVEEWDLV
jgi:hypothetical protein